MIVPEGVTDFGNAFCESSSVTEIVLPASLTHIEEALMWMNKRAEDRAERNVLGTYEK